MTVEEKAEKYANKKYQDPNEWVACYFGYMGGYAEAMRWRDPDVELPVDSCYVLVKTAEYRCYVCYFCLEREDFFHGDYRLQGVIGWRPIE